MLIDANAEEARGGPCEPRACVPYPVAFPCDMASSTTKSAPVRRTTIARKLGGAEIRRRLEQIELATVSSLRSLQMDVDGDEGVPSTEVLKKARAALR